MHELCSFITSITHGQLIMEQCMRSKGGDSAHLLLAQVQFQNRCGLSLLFNLTLALTDIIITTIIIIIFIVKQGDRLKCQHQNGRIH